MNPMVDVRDLAKLRKAVGKRLGERIKSKPQPDANLYDTVNVPLDEFGGLSK